jgi:hypothetical protein
MSPEPFTMLPNWLVDAMPDMSEAELKVCIFVARKTIGWHKEADRISLTQFEGGTGLHRETIVDGITAAEKRGMIAVVRQRGKTSEYRLAGGPIRFDLPTTSRNIRPVTSRKIRHTKESIQPEKNIDPIDFSHFKATVADRR